MGTQCSCANNAAPKQYEIQHDPDHNQNNEHDLKQSQATQASAAIVITAPKEQSIRHQICSVDKGGAVEESVDVEQTVQKSSRKKIKKIVQFMMPSAEMEENSDKIEFIQKQIDRNQKKLIVKTLKSHFILSQLTTDQILYIVHKMKFCTAKAGNYIFKQGDPSFSYYVILEGHCKVYIDNTFKKILDPGASFGDLGIIYNAPRSASIFAETDCLFAEMNSKAFKKIINDLNSMSEQENRKSLENLQFYKNLTQPQKNVLAANAIAQTYKAGQMIFNKGDAANAFYIIQQGIVTVLQKKVDLKSGDNVGINAIIGSANAIRASSLIAKTNCRLLCLTRGIIVKNLGDNVGNIIRRNLVFKIIKQSDIWEMYYEDQWIEVTEQIKVSNFNKGDIIIKKQDTFKPLQLYIILKSDGRSKLNPKGTYYIANSIIEQNKVFKKQQISFDDDFIVDNQAELVVIKLPEIKKAKKVAKAIETNGQTLSRYDKEDSESSNKVQKCKLDIKDFTIIRKLRSGNFGRVYACYNTNTKKKYSMKVMDKQSLMTSNLLPYIMKQEQLLRTLPTHPFLVKYNTMFTTHNLIMLVMELLEGEDLFDAINCKLPLKYKDYKFLISQIIMVIEHLHKNKVIYRDLKPENVVLSNDGYITLIDLGTAKKLTMQNRYKTMTIIGTPHYMAPEIILGKGYTFVSDWWSLGVMLYEMSSGKLPFGEQLEDPFAVYQDVIRSELKFSTGVNVQTQQLIEKLLIKNMNKRIKNQSGELKKMQFFSDIEWDKLLNKQLEGRVFPAKSSVISSEQIDKALSKKKQTSALQIFNKERQQTKAAV